ncbi:MAG: MFS transporter [Chloroflexi bacterium]|nr:MFS transporter [Chloroflexota bacterium]
MNSQLLFAKPFRLLVTHKTFAVLLATIVLMEIAHGVELIALFPLYLKDVMREGVDTIGITLSTYLVADILIRTPAGWLADRWARKPLLVIGILLSAFPLVLMPRVQSAQFFLALNAINGIGAGCIWPALYAAVADLYGKTRYGLVLGIINMVMLGGIALGPIAGGFLLSRVNYANAFYFCFAIALLAGALVVFFMREARPTRAENANDARLSFRAFARFMNPTLARLLFIGLLLTLAIGMMLPLVALFGREVLRVPPDIFALILIPPGILTIALIIPAGHWADRRGRHAPLIAGLFLIALPFAGAPLSTNLFIVSAGAMLAGLGYALLVPAWNALVMDYVPENARGLFLGAVATAQGVGLAIGPVIGGELWERVWVYAPFEVAAFFFLIAAGLAIIEMRAARK